MKREARYFIPLLLIGTLLAACGALPTPPWPPESTTQPPIPAPPGDGPVLTWHREGGIAGFCDDLSVYASGDAYGRSCKGAQSGELRHARLTDPQLEQLAAWMDRFESFHVSQTDPATADAMTIRLMFGGRGTATPGDAEKQDILDLASELYAQMTKQAGAVILSASEESRRF